jgi:hypothetical protein
MKRGCFFNHLDAAWAWEKHHRLHEDQVLRTLRKPVALSLNRLEHRVRPDAGYPETQNNNRILA